MLTATTPSPDDPDDLFTSLLGKLRELARRHMRKQQAGHTLRTTDLVHEAYVKLRNYPAFACHSEIQFLVLASRAMRQILVDHARRRSTKKRQPKGEELPLDAIAVEFEEASNGLLPLDESLTRLEALDPSATRLIELRFFGGQTMAQCATVLGMSERTTHRLWSDARAWLQGDLSA